MSGGFAINRPHELMWELRESDEQRAHRAALLGVVYAEVDPKGYDARRLGIGPAEARHMHQVLAQRPGPPAACPTCGHACSSHSGGDCAGGGCSTCSAATPKGPCA